MGVELLSLSVNIAITVAPSHSHWERVSSSLQGSTRGGIEYGTVEFKSSDSTCQVSPTNRAYSWLQAAAEKKALTLKYSSCSRRITNKTCSVWNCAKYDSHGIHSQWTQLNLPSVIERTGSLSQISCSLRTFITEENLKVSDESLDDRVKVGVLLLNLGGPETLRDVQPFLFNLFADPDIIRLPRLFRFLQMPLAQFISVLRAPKSREGYAAIGGGSPLRRITDEQADSLRKALQHKKVPAKVYVGMRYWHPFTEEAIKQIKNDGITKLVVLPLYPQFSISTSGSSLRLLERIFREDEYLVKMQHTVIPSWYQRQGYIKAMTNLMEKELKKFERPNEVMIFFSAHGVPLAYVEEAGDPYKAEMEECVDLIMKELKIRGLDNDHTLAYQKEEKTKDCHPKGKDKTKLTAIPLTGNRMQIRRSKLEHNSQEKEKEIPNWHKRTKRITEN